MGMQYTCTHTSLLLCDMTAVIYFRLCLSNICILPFHFVGSYLQPHFMDFVAKATTNIEPRMLRKQNVCLEKTITIHKIARSQTATATTT